VSASAPGARASRAVVLFGVTTTRFAYGGMVLSEQVSIVFALIERKNDRQKKKQYRCDEGLDWQLRIS
jgi:hypothetical protein